MTVAEFNALPRVERRELIVSYLERGLCESTRPKLWAYHVLDGEFSPEVHHMAVTGIINSASA